MTRHDSKKTIIQNLFQRELGVESHYIFNTKILKNLISQDSRSFNLIWEKHSRQPIYYENRKIYTDNYISCYFVNGLNLKPHPLYQLPLTTTKQKIQDGLLCEIPSVKIQLPKKNHRPFFLALTAHGWLHRYDATTGERLEEIFLSKKCRFKHLLWNELGYSFIIKSVINKTCPVARMAGIQDSNLVTIGLFNVFPVEFVALFEIHRDIFGKDISDAMIGENLLCVSHQNGFVRLYSVQHIFQQSQQFEAYLGLECDNFNGVVGAYPAGLPTNVIITDRPPILFEVKCEDNDLKMGGFPWHYIITPFKSNDIFKIYSMDSKTLAVNGTLESKQLSIRPDKALFHPDDSGRIMHVTSSELRVFHLSSHENITTVHESFSITMAATQPLKKIVVTQTSSGRTIRLRRTWDVEDPLLEQALITYGYENEIDLLVVLGADHYDNEDGIANNHVHLYDNIDGKFLKKIQLKQNWTEYLENNIILDLDVLVNIRKEFNGKFSCYVYSLCSNMD